MKRVRRMPPKNRNSRRSSGISWRLFGTLTLFVVLVLVVIWVFQIVLLNKFYETSKLEEFTDTDDFIFGLINNEKGMKEAVYTRSDETDTCIRLYKVVDGVATEIADSEVNMGCMLHSIPADALSSLYTRAAKNGGVYSKKIANPSDKNSSINALYVSIEISEKGEEYILMMDSELVPLDATVKTELTNVIEKIDELGDEQKAMLTEILTAITTANELSTQNNTLLSIVIKQLTQLDKNDKSSFLFLHLQA